MIIVNEIEVEFFHGITIAQAMDRAGKKVMESTIIMVDGKVISRSDTTRELSDGSEVKVLTLVSGG